MLTGLTSLPYDALKFHPGIVVASLYERRSKEIVPFFRAD